MQLRPMTADEFDTFLARTIAEYAADHVRAGTWMAEQAQAKAAAETEELLPQGLQTDGMLLLTAEDDGGVPIGILWLSLTHARSATPMGWIYDIEVFAERRGQGLGRQLLAAAEAEIARHGVGTLGLNVFGDNTVARALYESAGYGLTAAQMSKQVRPGP